MTNSDFLDTEDLAKLIRTSRRTVIRWRVERKGPAYIKAGQRVLYRRADVEAWLESRRREPMRDQGAA